MRSHLTHRVFRQILRNEPFTHAQCTRQLLHRLPRSYNALSIPSRQPLRSFWWGTKNTSKRTLKPEDRDPGIEELEKNETRLKDRVQSLPRLHVLGAINQLFKAKAEAQKPLLDTQLKPVIAAVKMLQSKDEPDEASLSIEDIQRALQVLCMGPNSKTQEHAELAELLVDCVTELRPALKEPSSDAGISEYYEDLDFRRTILVPYIKVLGSAGQGLKAREELENQLRLYPGSVVMSQYWRPVFQGLAKSDDEVGIKSTIEVMKRHGIPFDPACHANLLAGYVVQNKIDKVKTWYSFPVDTTSIPPTGRLKLVTETKIAVLKLCIATGEFDWGQPILNDMVHDSMSKSAWDIVLQWAAATRKGVDEIERMMTLMANKLADRDNERPDIDTINGLVEGANARNDAYTAERFLELAARWKIELNADTRILQMDYRLKIGDLDGARAAYKALKTHDVAHLQDVPVINKMILALINQDDIDYDEVIDYVLDITDRKASFEPKVIAGLATLHLKREEFTETIDLLNEYVFHLESDERAIVRDALVDFLLDTGNDVALSWDTYTILVDKFPEIENPLRIRIMNNFFDRGRVDMGVHTFGHMRQATLKERRPNAAAYAACFTGMAKLRDIQSVEVVHNMLRLDTQAEPDTQLHTALMLAYMGADVPSRSLDHWDDITYSREGPTYDSICIALLACQRGVRGGRAAKDIWARLKRLDVDISKEICDAYAAALVAEDFTDLAFETVREMEKTTGGSSPDVLTVAALHNAVQSREGLDAVTEWAQTHYPAFWAQLEKAGRIEIRFDVSKLEPPPPKGSTYWTWAAVAADEAEDPEEDEVFKAIEREYEEEQAEKRRVEKEEKERKAKEERALGE